MSRIIIFLLLILGTLAASCQEKRAPAPKPVKELVLDSLAHPWSIAFINSEEAFITEKEGDLLRVNLRTKERKIIENFPADLFQAFQINVADYAPRVYPTSIDGQTISGNAGILDVELHPDFPENQELYISYISAKDTTFALKVIRAKVENNRLENIRTVLNPGPYVPGLWHFGGGLLIDGDFLYVSAGERLFFEDRKQGLAIAQDVSDARGAIYRVNLDGSVPNDNPDLGADAIPGMYAFGIRATQGLAKRPNSDQIWFSEHGTNQGDEINMLIPGANYGWPNMTTGTWRSPGYEPASLEHPNYTDPIHYWLQTVAPTGLCFYTGTEFPSWKGNLIVPGLSRGSIWRMVLEGNTFSSAEELFLDDHVRSRKVAQSPDGQLYMLTDERNGKLIRITNKNL